MVNLSMARKHIELMYLDRCNIIECEKVVTRGITNVLETVAYENLPCKLSHERITQTGDGVAPNTALVSKLFINPDITVRPGSKIIVTRNGVTTTYESSSEAARFLNHQEIMLDLLEGYA